MQPISAFLIVLVFFAFFILSSAIKILKEYERGVIFRLGRLIGAKGPGIIFLIPIVDKMVKISLRTVVMDVPEQDVITKDNVSLKVNAVVYFRVIQPKTIFMQRRNYLKRPYAVYLVSRSWMNFFRKEKK
jgi:regulator of protease activity HflC (stomatin/prohibitin superfamily)